MALQGKEKGPRWKTSVVPGGVDAMGNKLPGYGLLTDEASGESKIIQPGQGAQLPAGMTKQVGTSGGKPVYEDAQGKRFVGG